MIKVFILTLVTFFLFLLESAPEIYSDKEVAYNEITDFKFIAIIFFISSILNLVIIDKKAKKMFYRIILNVFVLLMVIVKILDYIELNKSLN